MVEDEDLVNSIPNVLGNAIENLTECLHRVVGHHENRDPLARSRLDRGTNVGFFAFRARPRSKLLSINSNPPLSVVR